MRKDMSKVLCETYKQGSSWSIGKARNKKKFNKYFDEVGGKIGNAHMHKIAHIETKSFGENLNPLYRFVHRQVGRPWSKVYSEVCEHCNKNGAVSGHIFAHIWDVVTRPEEVYFVDGKPYRRGKYYGVGTPIQYTGGTYRNELYVDPRDDILKRGPWGKSYRTVERESREKRRKQEAAHKVVVSKELEFHKQYHHGPDQPPVWYRYVLKLLPPVREVIRAPLRLTITESLAWYNLPEAERRKTGYVDRVRNSYKSVFARTGRVLDKSSGRYSYPDVLAYPSRHAIEHPSYHGRKTSDMGKGVTHYYAEIRQATSKEIKKHNLG